jgi:hypothetical protein
MLPPADLPLVTPADLFAWCLLASSPCLPCCRPASCAPATLMPAVYAVAAIMVCVASAPGIIAWSTWSAP